MRCSNVESSGVRGRCWDGEEGTAAEEEEGGGGLGLGEGAFLGVGVCWGMSSGAGGGSESAPSKSARNGLLIPNRASIEAAFT